MSEAPVVLSQIWIYPIKSLGGVRVRRAAITAAGSLALDREWVIVDAENQMVWQGDLPRMALTRCALDADAITVTCPGLAPLRIERNHPGEPRSLTMYKHDFAGIDAGDAAARWLSAALGANVRLVRIGLSAHRWPGLNPVHALSTGSLAALNAALVANGGEPVEMERFRPNLVLAAAALPAYFEEQYAVIRFGDTELRRREPCVRCELPNISRLDANRGKQPLKLIGRLSRDRPTAAPASFGIYAMLSGAAAIAEGAGGVPVFRT